MVAKFDTSMIPGTKESGSNLLAYLLVFGIAAGCVYKFWWLPREEKKKLAAKKG